MQEAEKMKTEKTEKSHSIIAKLPKAFIGQNTIQKNIDLLIEKVKVSNEPLPHLLFIGEEGMGKKTLAGLMAKKLGRTIVMLASSEINNAGDLIGVLTNLEEGDFFVLADVEKLNKQVKDFIYPAIHNYQIDFVIDKGPYAKRIEFNLKHFTLITTTTNTYKLDSMIKKVFFATFEFDDYSKEEIEQILLNRADLLGVRLDDESSKSIAQKANGSPAEASDLLDKLCKYAKISKVTLITNNLVDEWHSFFTDQREQNGIDRSIPGDVRREVWRRDAGKCLECGSREKLEYDHIIPVSKGGSNTARNIRLLCENCNRKKRDNI